MMKIGLVNLGMLNLEQTAGTEDDGTTVDRSVHSRTKLENCKFLCQMTDIHRNICSLRNLQRSFDVVRKCFAILRYHGQKGIINGGVEALETASICCL